MQGATNLKRVIITATGNSNRINLSNAVMKEGLCGDKISGGTNSIVAYGTSARLVDVATGSGNDHNIDILFKPEEMKYNLTGNNICISMPLGTIVTQEIVNTETHTINEDGTPCLP